MKKVFTHENRMIVYNMRNLLQGEGIETVMKNEFSGGGVGDLPAFDTWPEIWVRDEAQTELAKAVLRAVTHAKASEDWVCDDCREANDVAFYLCWNCGHSRE